ncbi:conserved hypothetical protein [Ricinus communis]|uniref:Uncharacterized protein n=1 Tax=Ricinus communis TaxID=3988 RepID=B9SXR6_RICCO|nr:conserved hypothetical protein [Ricinus communis]
MSGTGQGVSGQDLSVECLVQAIENVTQVFLARQMPARASASVGAFLNVIREMQMVEYMRLNPPSFARTEIIEPKDFLEEVRISLTFYYIWV